MGLDFGNVGFPPSIAQSPVPKWHVGWHSARHPVAWLHGMPSGCRSQDPEVQADHASDLGIAISCGSLDGPNRRVTDKVVRT